MKGKGTSFKDVIVRRHKVEQALQWLIKYNPQYRSIKLDNTTLNSLPVDGVPTDLQVIETITDPEKKLNETRRLLRRSLRLPKRKWAQGCN